jgi:hypothetical protein
MEERVPRDEVIVVQESEPDEALPLLLGRLSGAFPSLRYWEEPRFEAKGREVGGLGASSADCIAHFARLTRGRT